MSSACSLTAQNRICCPAPFRPIVNCCPRWNRYSSKLQLEFTKHLAGREYVWHNNTRCSSEICTATSDDSHNPSNLSDKNIGTWVIGTRRKMIVDYGNLRSWPDTNLIVYPSLTLCTVHYQMKHIVRSRNFKVTFCFLFVHVHFFSLEYTYCHYFPSNRQTNRTSSLHIKCSYDTKLK